LINAVEKMHKLKCVYVKTGIDVSGIDVSKSKVTPKILTVYC